MIPDQFPLGYCPVTFSGLQLICTLAVLVGLWGVMWWAVRRRL